MAGTTLCALALKPDEEIPIAHRDEAR